MSNTYRYSKEIVDVMSNMGGYGIPRNRAFSEAAINVYGSIKYENYNKTGVKTGENVVPYTRSYTALSSSMSDWITPGYLKAVAEGIRFNKPMSKEEVFVNIRTFTGLIRKSWDHTDGKLVDVVTSLDFVVQPQDFPVNMPSLASCETLQGVDKTDAINTAFAEAHQMTAMLMVDLYEIRKAYTMLKSMVTEASSIVSKIKVASALRASPKKSGVDTIYRLSQQKNAGKRVLDINASAALKQTRLPLTKGNLDEGGSIRTPLKRLVYDVKKRKLVKIYVSKRYDPTDTALAYRKKVLSANRRTVTNANAAKYIKAETSKVLEAQLVLNYGLKPLLYSILGTIKGLPEESKPKHQSYRGFRQGEHVATSVYTTPDGASRYTITRTTKWRYRAVVETTYVAPILARLGLDFNHMVSTIHEVTWLSFAAGWFMDVQTYLNAVTPIEGKLSDQSSVSSKVVIDTVYKFERFACSFLKWGADYTLYPYSTEWHTVQVSLGRTVNVKPAFPGFSSQVRSLNHLLSGVALIFTMFGKSGLNKKIRL